MIVGMTKTQLKRAIGIIGKQIERIDLDFASGLLKAEAVERIMNRFVVDLERTKCELERHEPPRKGNWMATYTGVRFWPLDARGYEIYIRDIAHALAGKTRFGGHARAFYSVAQHSVMVADNLPKEYALIGLMHDATEAYVGDMVRPLKRCMPEFVKAEFALAQVIGKRFGLGSKLAKLPAKVVEADGRALMTERRDLINHLDFVWREDLEPFEQKITPLSPEDAERLFLRRFRELYQEAK